MKWLKALAEKADSRYGGSRGYHSPSSSLHLGHAPFPHPSGLSLVRRFGLSSQMLSWVSDRSAGFVLAGLLSMSVTIASSSARHLYTGPRTAQLQGSG